MLTRLQIRNFKRFEQADVELGKSVVIDPEITDKLDAIVDVARRAAPAPL